MLHSTSHCDYYDIESACACVNMFECVANLHNIVLYTKYRVFFYHGSHVSDILVITIIRVCLGCSNAILIKNVYNYVLANSMCYHKDSVT